MAEDAALKPMSKNFSRVVIVTTIVMAAFGVYMVVLWVSGIISQTLGGVGLIALLAAIVLFIDWTEDRRKTDGS